MGPYQFVQARNYTKGRTVPIRMIVIHTMESPIGARTAENVASWFGGTAAPKASAHYCVDTDSVVQCVRDTDVAWHAPGANAQGIGIELAGRAAMTAADWQKPDAQAVLTNAAKLCAELATKYAIPLKKLGASDVTIIGAMGFTGHVDVRKGFGKSNHWDPGPAFPWPEFLAMVKDQIEPPTVPDVAQLATVPAPPLVHDTNPPPDSEARLSWVRILDSQGVPWEVAPLYVGGVSLGQAVQLAADSGCVLPSPDLVDCIWRAADLKVAPLPRTFRLWNAEEMAGQATLKDQAGRIAKQIEGKTFRLLAGTHKDVVSVDGRIGLYGWHRLDGTPIQPLFFGHALAWRDYSQGLRMVRLSQG